MNKTTKLRLAGGVMILLNLWIIELYHLDGLTELLLLTFGFAAGYEYFVVRAASKDEEEPEEPKN